MTDSTDPKPPAKAYVWQVLTADQLPAMQAALEKLKSYTLGDHADLRIVDRSATGEDAWDHAYLAGNPNYTHAAIMAGWCREYSTTLEKMSAAWEFFLYGWEAQARAVAQVSKKVDLRHEAQWVLRLGAKINYGGTNAKPQTIYAANGQHWPSWTHDLDKAHPFKSRKEAQALLDILSAPELYGDEEWKPVVGQRNDFR